MDGREETCSYTTSAGEGRWWRVSLSSITSVGQVSLTLASPPHQVVVYLGTGQDLTHCHPLQVSILDTLGFDKANCKSQSNLKPGGQ